MCAGESVCQHKSMRNGAHPPNNRTSKSQTRGSSSDLAAWMIVLTPDLTLLLCVTGQDCPYLISWQSIQYLFSPNKATTVNLIVAQEEKSGGPQSHRSFIFRKWTEMKPSCCEITTICSRLSGNHIWQTGCPSFYWSNILSAYWSAILVSHTHSHTHTHTFTHTHTHTLWLQRDSRWRKRSV